MILVDINACIDIIIRININTYINTYINIYIYTHPIFNQMFQNHDTSEATAARSEADEGLNPPKNGNFQREI